MFGKHDRERLRAIEEELLTIKLDRPSVVGDLIPLVQELTELENVGLYALRNVTGRWGVERWHAVNAMRVAESRARAMFEHSAEFPLYYHPLSAPAGQRNRVVDALIWIKRHAPGTWEQSPMYRQVLAPLGISQYHQPRALLCDRAAVVGWFGGMHPRPATPRQLHLVGRLVAPMRKRLIAERALRASPTVHAALESMLDRIGSPAFLVNGRGMLIEANAAGRSLVDERGREIGAAISDAIAGRASNLALELISIRDGAVPAWVAVVKDASLDSRIVATVRCATHRWGLTPRQACVLERVVRGHANATIAADLSISERAVELHITALFDKVGVESRSALVAAVLLSSAS